MEWSSIQRVRLNKNDIVVGVVFVFFLLFRSDLKVLCCMLSFLIGTGYLISESFMIQNHLNYLVAGLSWFFYQNHPEKGISAGDFFSLRDIRTPLTNMTMENNIFFKRRIHLQMVGFPVVMLVFQGVYTVST